MNADDDWTPRSDAFTVLVEVSADKEMVNWSEFHEWMNGLRETVGATTIAWSEEQPWIISGWSPTLQYGRWTTDHFGRKEFDKRPHANLWQQITGVASVAMAYAWAAIHLVHAIEIGGYTIEHVWAGRTDEMVAIG